MLASSHVSSARRRPDFAGLSIATVSGISIAITAVFLLSMPLAHNMAGSRDFVAYWATGQQLVHHANPYDQDAMAHIEHSAGLVEDGILLMRNPPWALPLALPLGFMGLRTAAILWCLALLACMVFSVRSIRFMNGNPGNPFHWLGYSFTPALICLIMGQTSLFALLGLVLFLRLHRARPFAAGLSLWLCALKPHLFIPFAVVLVAWILVTRSYLVLAGAGAAIAATTASAYFIDPTAWIHYFEMMRAPAVEQEFIPCLSVALRLWVWPKATWIQYLPAACASVWALKVFWIRRRAWNWIRDGNLLMLVSLVAAPYCWIYDQGLALTGLLEGAYSTQSRRLVAVLAFISLAIGIELGAFRIASAAYLWTAPAWLVWYLAARFKPATKPIAEPSVH
ncbi:MAG TPA: glycosyltransferase 87 family protein [Terracidiphilus sp.]